jgi:hypothetical protein
MNRLEAGFCQVHNPYGGKPFRVSLARPDVDGFVFWTKNLGPFMGRLAEIHARDFPFVVQYTITGYPRALEARVTDSANAVGHMKMLANLYGADVAVWRYDPILFTSETPIEFHVENFRRLAEQLRGTTNEVVISFAQVYRKTKINLNLAAAKFGFTWSAPGSDKKRNLLTELLAISRQHGMKLTVCSQPEFVEAPAARCVDAERISRVCGRSVAGKLKANRPGCGCFASKDIGEYDTCINGCAYCYGVRSADLAQTNHKKHDPTGEFL